MKGMKGHEEGKALLVFLRGSFLLFYKQGSKDTVLRFHQSAVVLPS